MRVEDGQVHEPSRARVLGRLQRPDREDVLLRVERRRDHEHGVDVLHRPADGVGLREIGLDDLVGAQGGHPFTARRPVHDRTDPERSSPRRLQHIPATESGRPDHREQGRLFAVYGFRFGHFPVSSRWILDGFAAHDDGLVPRIRD